MLQPASFQQVGTAAEAVDVSKLMTRLKTLESERSSFIDQIMDYKDAMSHLSLLVTKQRETIKVLEDRLERSKPSDKLDLTEATVSSSSDWSFSSLGQESFSNNGNNDVLVDYNTTSCPPDFDAGSSLKDLDASVHRMHIFEDDEREKSSY